jgi:hypothetical protein
MCSLHASTTPWADIKVDHPVCYTFGETKYKDDDGGYGAYWITQVSRVH